MYSIGGTAYVYLCYGVHSLFNIVTNIEDVPHAVLIRGIYPSEGLEMMKIRTQKPDRLQRVQELDRAKCLNCWEYIILILA